MAMFSPPLAYLGFPLTRGTVGAVTNISAAMLSAGNVGAKPAVITSFGDLFPFGSTDDMDDQAAATVGGVANASPDYRAGPQSGNGSATSCMTGSQLNENPLGTQAPPLPGCLGC